MEPGYLPAALALCALLLSGCGGGNTGIDPNDRVDYEAMIARTQARTEARLQLENLQARIVEFQVKYSRLPESLDELVRFRLIDAIPQAPEGMAYHYDRQLGSVRMGPAVAQSIENLGEGIGTPSITQ